VYASTGQEADRSFASGLISYVEPYQNGDHPAAVSVMISGLLSVLAMIELFAPTSGSRSLARRRRRDHRHLPTPHKNHLSRQP
jgi:hypothetical protein